MCLQHCAHLPSKVLNCGLCRVGLRQPAIPVLFRDISVRATVNVGSRALPTLPNSVLNAAEVRYSFSHKALVL